MSCTVWFQQFEWNSSLQSDVDIKSQSEADLQDAIATIGPIAVAMDASHSSFQFYSSGVYSEAACSSTNLDFSLLAIGYGTTTENQWSTQWGMDCHVLMARNKNNQCAIAMMASYALIWSRAFDWMQKRGQFSFYLIRLTLEIYCDHKNHHDGKERRLRTHREWMKLRLLI